jgi:hypothetical protein
MESNMRTVPIELLDELLICRPEEGELVWRVRTFAHFSEVHVWKTWNIRYAGTLALNAIDGLGYKSGTIKGVRLKAHRVLWAMTHKGWPEGDIDHINGLRTDNRIANLRCVTRQENTKNRAIQSNSTSLVPGVTWLERNKKWRVRISVAGKRIDLGLYETFEGAVAARKEAERLHGFHINHGRVLPLRVKN